MKRLKPWHLIVVAALAVIVALVTWRLSSGTASEDNAPSGKALVTLAPVESGSVEETVTAYGTFAAAPGAGYTIAAPRGVIVEHVLVAPGQVISAGTPLVTLVNTPATDLAARQAADAVTFAKRDLERVQRLYDARLAASDQLDAAMKALADAKSAAAAQTRASADTSRQTITSPAAGVVGSVSATAGDHVSADAPLMNLVPGNGLAAMLSIEPEKARTLAAGQSVLITSAFDPAQSVHGQVTRIGQLVDPATHMITVTVALDGRGFALGGAVEGRITVARHPGLRVPRAAVVYDEDGAHVFVIRTGKARLVPVTPGTEDGASIEIRGEVHAGDMVAVSGAYQLEDGWSVRTAAK